MKILILGESCKDVFHYGICERLCPAAPVPVFKSLELIENGGMAMNVYNNTISLGADSRIITNENWNNVTKTRFVERRSNYMFMRLDEGDDKYGECDISGVDFSLYDAVVVSDYNKGFMSSELMRDISLSHDLVFLDSKRKLGDWCENFSFIKINDSEFKNNVGNLCSKIKDKMIITQGPKGCIYRGNKYSVPLVEVKDLSGAGDTFLSGLCVKFCETKDIEKSIKFANKCATSVVQKRGVSVV